MDNNRLLKFFRLDRLFDGISHYLEARLRLFKLEMGEVIADSSAKLIQIIAVGLLLSLALLFLSLSASIFLGELLNNYGMGFLIVGGFYLLTGIILYLVWDKLGLKEKIYKYLGKKLEEENERSLD